jgi:hypothetical protein
MASDSNGNNAKKQSAFYYGESACQRTEKCKNRAYYFSHGAAVCGVHSKGDNGRQPLPENPRKGEIEEEKLKAMKEAALVAPIGQDRIRGCIALRKLGMMKPTPLVSGYFTVLPNRRAKSKGDVVWAMPALSPMVLGPVEHGQPGLDPAENLENFHQFNKVFAAELDEEKGKPKAVWYERRERGYADTEPHRHKLGATKADHIKKAGIAPGASANACKFSIFVAPDGKELHFGYVESRVFYCTFYERLARKTSALNKLVDTLYVHKQSIIIAGYDARNAEDAEITADVINRWYSDPSWPFGHEMVLHAILFHWNCPEELPWRKAAAQLSFKL